MNVYEDVKAFYESYRGEKRVIGRSEEGRELFAMRTGRTSPVGISQYAIHGREWITAYLALEHLRRGVSRGSVWVVPLTNPDGALLSATGKAPLWKANARGVDLNVNFDARWGTGKYNVRQPASENFIGDAPFSAAETRALRDFTLEIRPAYTVSWHTKGEVVYWEFHQPLLRRMRDRRYAEVLSRSTGYPLASAEGSAGGYKDWCIEALKIPAFTVEAGEERLPHPLGKSALNNLLSHSLDALDALSGAFTGE